MTMRNYRAKKGAYGGEITYQLRIQRFKECDVTMTRKLQSFGCKVGFVLRTSIKILKNIYIYIYAVVRRLSSFLKKLLV